MTLELLVALAVLTPCQREAFVDRFLVGRTNGDIAETMGCTRSNVGKLLRRARAELVAQLEVAA